MDNTEDQYNPRYAPKPYSLNRQKLPLYSHPIPSRHVYPGDEEAEAEEEQVNEYDYDHHHQHHHQINDFERQRKKRKVKTKNWVPGYDDYNTESDVNWSEHEKFVLLEIWGDRFLQLGRKSLRNEDWGEVAEKVTDALKIETNETQCRQIMDDLKRRYKKERVKVEKLGFSSKWVFFKKMDMLMLRRKECGLACGVDSGEFVFMDTGVYLERSNGFDEMRDSPCESEMEEEEEEEEEEEDEGEEMRVLADSVQRFGEIYEKIESSKREQMRELERMRVEFCRELEVQKKQILERTQAEIAKIREGDEDEEEEDSDDDDDDDEVENLSE